MMIVPLIVGDRAIGALAIMTRTERHFTDEEQELLDLFAAKAATALENARLFEEHQRKVEELSILNEVARSVTGQVDIAKLAEAVQRQVGRVLDARSITFALYDGAAAQFDLVLDMRDGVRGAPDRRIPYGPGLLTNVVEHRRPVRTADYPAACRAEGVEPVAGWQRFPCWLGVPMVADDAVVGAIVLRSAVHVFTEADERLLSNIASVTALAARSARLYGEAEQRQKRLAALVDVAQRLTRGLDQASILDTLAEAAGEVFEGEAGFRLVEGEFLVRLGATPGALAIMKSERLRMGESISGGVATTGEPIITHDIWSDPRVIDAHRGPRTDLGALMCLPMRTGSAVLGTLNIYRETGHRFGPEAIALAMTFANQAAIALENARLFARTEARRQEAQAIADVGRVLAETLDPDVVGQRVVASLSGLLGTRSAALYSVDPESGNIVAIATWGATPEDVPPRFVFARGMGVVGRVVEERRAVVCTNLLTDPRITHPPDSRRRIEALPYRAALGVPLQIQGRVIGALFVGDKESRIFGDEDIRLAETFANQVAIALENARLFARTEARRREAEALAELGQVLSQTLDPDVIGERVVRTICTLLGAKTAALFALDADSGDLVAMAATAGLDSLIARRLVFPQGTGVVGRVAQERAPAVTANLLTDPRVVLTETQRPLIELAGYRAVLGVPLQVQGRVIGCLGVGDVEGRVFTDEDVRIAQTFADQAALALESARHYTEAQRALGELRTKNAELDSFVYSVSHDLKSPLVAAQGMAGALIEDYGDRLEPQARHYIERLQTNVLHMERLIEDLLSSSTTASASTPRTTRRCSSSSSASARSRPRARESVWRSCGRSSRAPAVGFGWNRRRARGRRSGSRGRPAPGGATWSGLGR